MKKKKLNKENFKRHVNSSAKDIKKIEVVVTGKKGKTSIPLTKYEMYNLSEWTFICSDTCGNLKLNKMDLTSICNKIQHLEFDIINDGRVYSLEGELQKEKHYLIKKPRWKK